MLHNKRVQFVLFAKLYMVIKYRRVRWVRHVPLMGLRNAYKVSVKNLKGISHFSDLGVYGRRVLKGILRK